MILLSVALVLCLVAPATATYSCAYHTCPYTTCDDSWGYAVCCPGWCYRGRSGKKKVCGSDGHTYASECVMKQHACRTHTRITLAPCKPAVPGGWSKWSAFGPCSKKCSVGTQRRFRTCTNPKPKYGGAHCKGSPLESRLCGGPCRAKIHGAWSEYGRFTPCTRTCGGGIKYRKRTCTNPPPSGGGLPCLGSATEKVGCGSLTCPVPIDGKWTRWSSFSECSKPCRGGTMYRMRACRNPPPANGGKHCVGTAYEIRSCNDAIVCPNPVDGDWGPWTQYSTCSKPCGVGFRYRTRNCSNPFPMNGGAYCSGPHFMTESCTITQRCITPIDGIWSDYRLWSKCTRSCGGGKRYRKRTCTNPPASNGGTPCVGSPTEIQDCNSQQCLGSVDGGWTLWTDFTPCSVVCGGGTQYRKRSCTNPLPSNKGMPCVGPCAEVQSCGDTICPAGPRNGAYTPWSSFGQCSKACGGGVQIRFRSCTNPAPRNGGFPCFGPDRDFNICNTQGCPKPTNGGWGPWSDYGDCTTTCGDSGARIRTRTCTNPPPSSDGAPCVGDAQQTIACDRNDCPVLRRGGWGPWTSYGQCSEPCGQGFKVRRRECNNPVPRFFDLPCVGPGFETMACQVVSCPAPIDGIWNNWKSWTPCTRTCDGGTRYRTRSCDNPAPSNGGRECPGTNVEVEDCNLTPCLGPINGKWGDWTQFSQCSKPCGGGVKTRTRECNNPSPQRRGLPCKGLNVDCQDCNTNPCTVPINGEWGSFGPYTTCTKTCGGGIQHRSRVCNSPSPRNGGRPCLGTSFESRTCANNPCDVIINGGWDTWSGYGSCSEPCGGGIRYRTRTCTRPPPSNGGLPCEGTNTETQTCNVQDCAVPINGGWTDYSDFSQCTKTCGGGTQFRTRSCTNPTPSNGGRTCSGSNIEIVDCNDSPCPVPVNGSWSSWSIFGACSKTCGRGVETRTRTCTNPPPSNGGVPCQGLDKDHRECVESVCRDGVDGSWTQWENFSPCSKTCGTGVTIRRRFCTNPPPSGRGLPCFGSAFETRACKEADCIVPINGEWSIYSLFGPCTRTCGGGVQVRSRTCTNPPPSNGGRTCIGSAYDARPCGNVRCPVNIDGKWSGWTSYDQCSKTCGQGFESRRRFCNNPSPRNLGLPCVGPKYETRSCQIAACPDAIDGNWGDWSTYSTCSRTCDGGTQFRTRTCSNPPPSNGGSYCNGLNVESRVCNLNPCLGPVNGTWSQWSQFTLCSKSCGVGVRTRTRSCNNPPPLRGGVPCVGLPVDCEDCNTNACPGPINGGWGSFVPLNGCSKPCGGGFLLQLRSCNNPVPSNGGLPCVGQAFASQACNTQRCPVPINGGWNQWSDYNRCSKPCGTGKHFRLRTCTRPEPANGGAPCQGSVAEIKDCNIQQCAGPVNGRWNDWTSFSECSVTCGLGSRFRTRKCTNPPPSNGGLQCIGSNIDVAQCNLGSCPVPVNGMWSDWSSFGACSKTCGTGVQARNRTCTNPPPSNGGVPCQGLDTDHQSCATDSCETGIDGVWSAWSGYSSCSQTCGAGFQTRTRLCNNPAPSGGGRPCVGSKAETQACSTQDCPVPVDGGWTTFVDVGECTKTCGGGYQLSVRTCTNPPPSNNGLPCLGEDSRTRVCGTTPCQVTLRGRWGDWTSWEICSKTCGNGFQVRRRFCNNPSPTGDGLPCDGPEVETRSCLVKQCEGAVDGRWAQWSRFSQCTRDCDGGTQFRTRTCTNPIPANGGADCPGLNVDGRSCNQNRCLGPINGSWSDWSLFTACSKTCGNGVRTRTRTCTNPPPQRGGLPCKGLRIDCVDCANSECLPPVDGGWGPFRRFTSCTKTCGGGVQFQSRICNRPFPQRNGVPCIGDSFRTRQCNTRPCPVPINGNWSTWTQFSPCSKACGVGVRFRTRFCTNPTPANGGKPCQGSPVETQSCRDQHCSVPRDGGWDNWSSYTECSKTCGGGTRFRTRKCTNPLPANGGNLCVGSNIQVLVCAANACTVPVNGSWSTWSSFGSCSKTCGSGAKTRTRTCTNPRPLHGGVPCQGLARDHAECVERLCQATIDGNWNQWSSFTTCTKTCDGGTSYRTRTCTNPPPSNGGRPCVGSGVETTACETQICIRPRNGGWGLYSSWTVCSKSCGGGTQYRRRFCTNPRPLNNGLPCVGRSFMSRQCNTQNCPVPRPGGWSDYEPWTTCTKSCGSGTQYRERACNNPAPAMGGAVCQGSSVQTRLCSTNACLVPVNGAWSDWTAFSSCSRTCGGGTQVRTRTCTRPAPSNGGFPCDGLSFDYRTCNTIPCSVPVDGGWTDYGAFSSCSVSCGGGVQYRSRSCTSPPPSNNGLPCPGSAIITSSCNTQQCPPDQVNGGWGSWSDLSQCSKPCGPGISIQSRQCNNPSPANGGYPCVGPAIRAVNCNLGVCPGRIDGNWSRWTLYTQCTKTCGGGTQHRTRTCTNPPFENGGRKCQGDSVEVLACGTVSCPVPIDGSWSDWVPDGKCSRTCDGGFLRRTRTCSNPPPSNGGLFCSGQMVSIIACGQTPCQAPMVAGYGQWSFFGKCSKPCGGGCQVRTRLCDSPPPEPEGMPCVGPDTETRSCNDDPCKVPIDGVWSGWGNYSQCSVTCGLGKQYRQRTCSDPLYGGLPCPGSDTESRLCQRPACKLPVDGGWSSYSLFSRCTKTCGGGFQFQTRSCTNPPPSNGGKKCQGENVISRRCGLPSCPGRVDGNWGQWTDYSDCSKTCGRGVRFRERQCNNPQPSRGGFPCIGKRREAEICNSQACSDGVPGSWSTWSSYSTCTKTCGRGTQSRERTCTSPPPSNGGMPCLGSPTQTRFCNIQDCPVVIDGNWSSWSRTYSTCSVTCGGGVQYRQRTCTNPAPQNGGKPCPGPKTETRACRTNRCPDVIDGTWGDWTPFSACSVECGTGIQVRTRNCNNPPPANGGMDCIGSSVDIKECNRGPCAGPIDGNWSRWTLYTNCTKNCGGGTRYRTRTCTDPPFSNGGRKCQGDSVEVKACAADQCPVPVDGSWSAWRLIGLCSKTCDGGFQRRIRTCSNPAPSNGGLYCSGQSIDFVVCGRTSCPELGQRVWNPWSSYGACSKSCGGGIQIRTRTCSDLVPGSGSLPCTGPDTESRLCINSPQCPVTVDGVWSQWSNYGACSVTCGDGFQYRSRSCSNPAPQNGGKPCAGSEIQSRTCTLSGCLKPIDGGWSQRSDFSRCTKTCGGGFQFQTRSCTNPRPSNGGKKCLGPNVFTRLCNTNPCQGPTDGEWGAWNSFSLCSKSCGSGMRFRDRQCNSPPPSPRGLPCFGRERETELCNTQPCTSGIPGDWTSWSSYSSCSVTCGVGTQSRTRTCTNPPPRNGGLPCLGSPSETKTCVVRASCPVDGNWSTWSLIYSTCSVTCGGGEQYRQRTCTKPAPRNGGLPCLGPGTESRVCNVNACPAPTDGNWGSWSSYGICSKTCGNGVQIRTRACNNPARSNGGLPCPGSDVESRSCLVRSCPRVQDDIWGRWSAFTQCTKTCGRGTQYRTRTCISSSFGRRGRKCQGDSVQVVACETNQCPVPRNGGWSRWVLFGRCSKSCGGGYQIRRRSCNNPSPLNGGLSCEGPSLEFVNCNPTPCRRPRPGGWSQWTVFSRCSTACGGGFQYRMRSCTRPTPSVGGLPCLGSSIESRSCGNAICPVPRNGGWNVWSIYGGCSVTCGSGIEYRTRQCNAPSPAFGGLPCPGSGTETRACVRADCTVPIDGRWTRFSDFSPCTKSCGGGIQFQTRSCTNPPPSNGGKKCQGPNVIERVCNTDPCQGQVNGNWGRWSPFGSCTKSCGGGMQFRDRLCNNPPASRNGFPCFGPARSSQACATNPCDGGIPGAWSDWSPFTECSEPCGGGAQSRTRTCTNPRPSNGGMPCLGSSSETRICNTNACPIPINGQWNTWSGFSSCSQSCGGGIQFRTRTCDNPIPQNGGLFCDGSSTETKSCGNQQCAGPIDGSWARYGPYSACTKTCGGGTQFRLRLCNQPSPARGGRNCPGPNVETQSCAQNLCPVRTDGGWTDFSAFSRCSRSCGGGTQYRTRSCTNPPPANGGLPCTGTKAETRVCGTAACPVDGGWSSYSIWSVCSVSCGAGVQYRTRQCNDPAPTNGGLPCEGEQTETRACSRARCNVPVDGRWSEFTTFSACSRSCGGGVRLRIRFCNNPRPLFGGRFCVGSPFETQPCNTAPCFVPINGGWGKFSTFSKCNKPCGGGTQFRVRKCDSPAPSRGGMPCVGPSVEMQNCNAVRCPVCVDGKWSSYGAFGKCSVTCGTGLQYRERTCTNPAPNSCGLPCMGSAVEIKPCKMPPCGPPANPCKGYDCSSRPYSVCKMVHSKPSCVCPRMCKRVKRTFFSPSMVCGSDGNTYRHKCYLQMKACRNKVKISVMRRGPCFYG